MKRIEINGVKFSPDEIKCVTISRGGKEIYIEQPKPSQPVIQGFAGHKPPQR